MSASSFQDWLDRGSPWPDDDPAQMSIFSVPGCRDTPPVHAWTKLCTHGKIEADIEVAPRRANARSHDCHRSASEPA